MLPRIVSAGMTWAGLTSLIFSVACSPSSLVDVQAPNTVVDPTQIATATGALQLRVGALGAFSRVILGNSSCQNTVVCVGGMFTDELTDAQFVSSGADARRIVDLSGSNPQVAGAGLYFALHDARIRLQMARQALALYASNTPSVPVAWQGELFALEGYTVLWFAENFCSGIPLTSVPLVGPQQLTAGFTTNELYARAIALFDSAMVAGSDSAQFVNLARVGKGRALLGLGKFAAADSVVRNVPIDFVYWVQFTPNGDYKNQFSSVSSVYVQIRVQDREGTNGLAWSTDPRTAVVTASNTGAMLRPAKYNVTPDGFLDPTVPEPGAPFRLADGLEAQLIHAEAALATGGGDWLTTLGTLRSTCLGSAACAPVPGLSAGNLPDTLTDPGTSDARLDLLMRERAMWLYLTGHRLADLRRLAHIYHRDPETLWPTGLISSPAIPPLVDSPLPTDGTYYGADVVLQPSPEEQKNNALYGGCYDFEP